MAKIINPAHIEYVQRQTLEYRFHSDPESGFSFDLENGKPVFSCPEAEVNYEWCKKHPELVEFMGIISSKWSHREPALAECECGEIVYLLDEYYDCSKCPHCGRWHSIGGYLVNPPEEWTEELEPD